MIFGFWATGEVFACPPAEARQNDLLRIGHPGGGVDIGAVVEVDHDHCIYKKAVIGRTARHLMEGYVPGPERHSI